MRHDAIDDPVAELVRPFAWISVVAFLAGFLLVIALGAPRLRAEGFLSPQSPAASVLYPAAPAEGRRAI